MFGRILDATFSSNLFELAEGLSRLFPALGLHKGIFESLNLPLNFLNLHQTQNQAKDETLDWPRIFISLTWNCASVLKPHAYHLE